MSRTVRRCARALAAAVAVCGILLVAAPAASADPKIPFSQDVYARTHLAKSGMDITVPPGQFDGTIDLATGEQTGTLTLPPATVTINLFGLIPAADASFVMAPAGPITGHVNLATFEVDTTASFNVQLAELRPHGTNLNLVGDGCTTMEPITVRMQGVVDPAAGGTFASTYTIPQFEDCGLLTPVISALVSGPGNTFVATFAPHGAPPPPGAGGPPSTPAPLATIDLHGAATVGGTEVPLDKRIEIPGAPPLATATPAPASSAPPAAALPALPLPAAPIPVAPPALAAPPVAPAPVAPPPVPAPPLPPAPSTAVPAPPPAGGVGGLLGSLLGLG
jgi:hypothetical protein